MKSKTELSTKHKLSIEQLHHFRCSVCDKWWSIGDPQITNKKIKELYCPWCGIIGKIK